jgi:hypothetical protein
VEQWSGGPLGWGPVEWRSGRPTQGWDLVGQGVGVSPEWSSGSTGLWGGGLVGELFFSKSWHQETFHELGVQSVKVSALPCAIVFQSPSWILLQLKYILDPFLSSVLRIAQFEAYAHSNNLIHTFSWYSASSILFGIIPFILCMYYMFVHISAARFQQKV